MSVGVAIPTIPPRSALLGRALASVYAQTRTPRHLSVACDTHGDGAAATRNRAWRALDTDWVAFLDDDDELYPQHLERLVATACDRDADFVYPWFEVVGGVDPFPQHFGQPWNPAAPVQTTITGLWRRTALEAVGGFPEPADEVDPLGNRLGEDMLAVLALNRAGGRIVHLPERTWRWHHHASNTSGLPERWLR